MGQPDSFSRTKNRHFEIFYQLTMLIIEAVSFSAQVCKHYGANGNRLDLQSAEILCAENRANNNDHHQTSQSEENRFR